MSVPFEQANLNLFLQLADLGAERRLRNMESPCRPPETQFFRDCKKVTKVSKFHTVSLIASNYHRNYNKLLPKRLPEDDNPIRSLSRPVNNRRPHERGKELDLSSGAYVEPSRQSLWFETGRFLEVASFMSQHNSQTEIPVTPRMSSPGLRFREALDRECPLQIVGAINANHALLAKQSGFLAIYLSGGGVAAGSLGVPDLGITNLEDVLIDVRRITDVCDLPLLVDADTGFGVSALNVARTTKSLIKCGAAAMQIEDQVGAKRCGHRPNKEVVSTEEMADRLKSAADARTDQSFAIMARTDSLAIEGLEHAIERSIAYVEAGADMIFAEAVTDLSMYGRFADATKVPILANVTEFGMTPLASVEELAKVGVSLVLYPLSAFRAMNKAAQGVYAAIRRDGTQANVVKSMQTREELYESINYAAVEKQLDAIRSKESSAPGSAGMKDK